MSRRDRQPDAVDTSYEDLVWLVPCDPDWALAIWQVGSEAISTARSRMASPLGQAEMQLRVYPVGSAKGRRRSVQVYRIESWIGQRLVLLQRPGCTHLATVGFVDAAGAFVPVARSAPTRPPHGGHSAVRARLAVAEPGPQEGVVSEDGE